MNLLDRIFGVRIKKVFYYMALILIPPLSIWLYIQDQPKDQGDSFECTTKIPKTTSWH